MFYGGGFANEQVPFTQGRGRNRGGRGNYGGHHGNRGIPTSSNVPPLIPTHNRYQPLYNENNTDNRATTNSTSEQMDQPAHEQHEEAPNERHHAPRYDQPPPEQHHDRAPLHRRPTTNSQDRRERETSATGINKQGARNESIVLSDGEDMESYVPKVQAPQSQSEKQPVDPTRLRSLSRPKEKTTAQQQA